MFLALIIDYEILSLNDRVLRVLKTETISVVQKRIIGRWKGLNSQGQRRLVPFKNDIWLVSYILDPYYIPKNWIKMGKTCSKLVKIARKWDEKEF